MSLRWRTIGTLCCLLGYAMAVPVPEDAKPAEGDAAKPAEGEAAKPAEGDAAKPAEGDAAKPAEGDAAKPAEGDAAKPAEGDAAEGNATKPEEGDTAKPAEGNATKPEEGDAAKPAEGNGTKPEEGDATKPAEGNGTKPEGDAAEGNATAAEGGETNSKDVKLAGEDTPAAAEGDNATTPEAPAGETGETTTAGGASDGATDTTPSLIMLTMEADATIPGNVFTDKYGQPLKISDMKNISLPGGGIMNIMTEQWQTYYTHAPIIPGCQCITRGPLPRFKLIGNIHFPKIKVTPERYVTLPTEPTSTICPPCICPTCPHESEIDFS